jgi:hypothetical protein
MNPACRFSSFTVSTCLTAQNTFGQEEHSDENAKFAETSSSFKSVVMPAKRILDFDGILDRRIKRVKTSSAVGPYATLSHCWGKDPPLVTTYHTLADQMNGIPWDGLSPGFKTRLRWPQDKQFVTSGSTL